MCARVMGSGGVGGVGGVNHMETACNNYNSLIAAMLSEASDVRASHRHPKAARRGSPVATFCAQSEETVTPSRPETQCSFLSPHPSLPQGSGC